MEGLNSYRKAFKEAVSRTTGIDSVRPRGMAIQAGLDQNMGKYFSLPEHRLNPIQDLDPDSPTFGQLYFIPGIDSPGDGTKIL